MDDDILQEFLAESWENLGRLDTDIVALEREPHDAELLASIFRTIHTLKGTCGFLGLAGLGLLTIRPLCLGLIRLFARIPVVGRFAPRAKTLLPPPWHR